MGVEPILAAYETAFYPIEHRVVSASYIPLKPYMFMKKSQAQLFKLADKFQKKYGQTQTLQQIIENAAGWGESSPNGIMNFPAQLKKDKADLSINVNITSGLMGGLKVSVSDPTVTPPQFAPNYARLSDQIQKYLDKYIKDFPQVPQGVTTLQYSGRGTEDSIAQG